MAELETRTLPLLPLTSGVVLPGMVVTLALETADAVAAVDAAGVDARPDATGEVVLVPRLERGFARMGTVARIEHRGELPDGTSAVVLRGLRRAELGAGVGTGPGLRVEVRDVDEPPTATPRTEELAAEYRALVQGIAERSGAPRLAEAIRGVRHPGALADTAGWSPELSPAQRVELLETADIETRLALVVGWAREALADLEVSARIRREVTDGLEQGQRETILRRQLEAIRHELGDLDDAGGYAAKLAERDLPPAVRAAVERELERLERAGSQNPEHQWIRTWLDTVLELPWDVHSPDRLDLREARAILDADHTGLADVKERIVEHLAVRKLRAERGLDARPDGRGDGLVLALVGPPGVGKTSLGASVARALGRRFVRVALGGVHDEAEIRGHRRTYVGAMAGRIARALREAGTMNPVVLLDEVDKLAADWRGDPSSALLEVLDPAQNHTFRDHYLDLDLDLSEVLFLATANVVETIPAALLDRMEVVRLDGYTEDEKVAIARDHLLPRQQERQGLRVDDVAVTDAALRVIVGSYTREAGVRALERAVGKVLRRVASRLAGGGAEVGPVEVGPVEVGPDEVRASLGRPPFEEDPLAGPRVPGVATGLAVTGAGGEVLLVEASTIDGEAGLTVTGQLGGVMRESAEIARSYVRAHAGELGLAPGSADHHLHLHVPAGAVPKDGPSAGVTMVTALTSLLSGRTVRPGIGMTGEVTLRGRVLPIGGLKQKVLAARRAGLETVVLPAGNAGDLEELPETVRGALTFVLASHVDDVLKAALGAAEPTGGQAAA